MFAGVGAEDIDAIMDGFVRDIDTGIQSKSLFPKPFLWQQLLCHNTESLSEHATFLLNLNPSSIHIVRVRERVSGIFPNRIFIKLD